MQFWWANPIDMKADEEHVAGEVAAQPAMVAWFGQIVKPPKRLMIDTINVSVSAVGTWYLCEMVELDNDEIKAENVEHAFVGFGFGDSFVNINTL